MHCVTFSPREEDGIFTKTITINNAQTEDFSQYQCTVSIGEETSIITFWLNAVNGRR